MLTSKSMMFNGEYIENLIEGYTTLNVTGREMAEAEVDSLTVGNRDGAILRGVKYKPRILTIEFCMEGDNLGFNPDNTVLLDRLNQLNGILDMEDEVPIIFRDEPDKFYTGIRYGLPQATMALGIIRGSFQLYCADPFKYSVDEIVAEPTLTDSAGHQVFMIDYQGTHKTYPTYEAQFYTQNTAPRVASINESSLTEEDREGTATSIRNTSSKGDEDEAIAGKGACGYVAFYDDQEHILQFGDPNEDGQPDASLVPKTLVNQNFQTPGTWSETVQDKWVQNGGTIPSGWERQGYYQIGASYNNAVSVTTTNNMLKNAAGTNVTYSLKAVCSNRSASGVKLTITITSSKFTAAVPYNAALVAVISRNGTEISRKVLKTASKTKTTGALAKGKTVSMTVAFTVSDIGSATSTLGGFTFRVERTGGTGTVGALGNKACNTLTIPVYISPAVNSYYLTPNRASISSGHSGKMHGPDIYREIPADAAGNRGWTDFTADFHLKFCVGAGANDTNQCGAVYVGVISGTYNSSTGVLTNPRILAAVAVRKYAAGNAGSYNIIAEGNAVLVDQKIDLSFYNTSFGNNRAAYTSYTTKTVTTGTGKKKKTTTQKVAVKHAATTSNKHITITKSGKNITFNVGGKSYTYKNAVASSKAYRVVVGMYAYSGLPPMSWMGLYNVKFTPKIVNQIETTIPFTTGDFLSAESSTGDVYLNDTLAPELGALGNDWEKMYLTPGMNYIGTGYSDWCEEDIYRQCNEDDFFDANVQYYTKISGGGYSPAAPDETSFNNSQSSFYIKESTAPQFTIRYREVYS